MPENPKIMAERLTEYVEELLEAKKMDNKLAIKGRTQMILNLLDKLREAHKSSPLPKSLNTKREKASQSSTTEDLQ